MTARGGIGEAGPGEARDEADEGLPRSVEESLRRDEEAARRSCGGVMETAVLALAAVSVGITASFLYELWRQAAM